MHEHIFTVHFYCTITKDDITAMPKEFFTCQADFHGSVYNATQLCRILVHDDVQKLEFPGIYDTSENTTVSIVMIYLQNHIDIEQM